MRYLNRAGALRACAVGVLLLVGATAAHAVDAPAAEPAGAIAPEGVRDLVADGAQRVELILLEDKGVMRPVDDFGHRTTVVFACWTLSKRRCREEALRLQADRKERTYYLTGTPVEWVAAKLAFDQVPQPQLEARLRDLTSITAADLASARRDATEFTLLDVRSGVREHDARIDGAIAMPSGRILDKRAMLPKNGWIVVYDAGDGRAESTAAALRAEGFPMAVALAGGYPAWVRSEQR
jgi:rhodanese-related sulfurtransferase